MNEFVKSFYLENNDLWGEPQKYKNIYFYPLKLDEIKYHEMMYRLFTYPKKYIKDKQIQEISYFKFLVFIIQSNIDSKYNMQDELKAFLSHCTKIKNVEIFWNGKTSSPDINQISFKLLIGDVEFDELEFDNIREIVLEQNGLDVDTIEQYIPGLEESLAFYNRESADITFSDQILAFSAIMKKTFNELREYTLYQFQKQLERLVMLKEYDLYKPLEASGQIKMPSGGEIKHYLSHVKKRGRYDSILVKTDSFIESNDIFKVT